MEFRILGSLEVEHEGELLKLGGSKQRAVLALLLLHANDVVPRERLIDELWGGDRPTPRRRPVQVTSRGCERRSAAGDRQQRRPGYVLEAEPSEVDLERFERWSTEGRAALEPASRRRREDSAPRRSRCGAGRRSPIATSPSRGRERPPRGAAARGGRGADRGRFRARRQPSSSELEPRAEHPLRERLRGQLMLALYLSGRQAEALEAYRQGPACSQRSWGSSQVRS